MNGETGHGFEEPHRGNQERDRVRTDRRNPFQERFADEHGSDHAGKSEHPLDDQELLTDEKSLALSGEISVAQADEVGKARVKRIGDGDRRQDERVEQGRGATGSDRGIVPAIDHVWASPRIGCGELRGICCGMALDREGRATPSKYTPSVSIEPNPPSTIDDPTLESPVDRLVAEMLAREDGDIDVADLADAVEKQEPADAADTLETIESMEEGDAAEVIEEMDESAAAEALAHMESHLAASVLEDLIDEDLACAARLVGRMAPDDAADLLQGLPEDYRSRLLPILPHEASIKVRHLLRYDAESAGGMMTTDLWAIRETMTVRDATEHIRRSNTTEDATHAFVVDGHNHLVGIVALRRLLLARPDERVEAIMDREVDAIPPTLDREAVAKEFDRYDFAILPVVDSQRRLLGVVTVDDVIDIIRAEQTEDTQRMVGAGKEEGVHSDLGEKFRSRFPWLCVNLVTSSLGAFVVSRFGMLISELAILAAIMPVIANQAGNAGQQSLAVTLRGIVLDQVRTERIGRIVGRETLVGLMNGVLAGMIVGSCVAVLELFLGTASWRLGIVAAIAMSGALTIGTLTGTSLPLLMRRLGFDPATASTIFLTMVTDTMSFLVFLGLVALLWRWVI